MGYKLKKLSIDNFKYIEHGKTRIIDFEDYSITILDGPNGYGKSTFFDAIELLVTGSIKHFNDELLNKGKESLVVLANDRNFMVRIDAIFGCENEEIAVTRIFDCEKNFESTILINDREIVSQEQFYEILGMNKNLFDIGVYVSQSESLEFLQKKYKERKEQLTGILDSSEISTRISEMRNFRDIFDRKCENGSQVLRNYRNELEQKIEILTRSSKKLDGDPGKVTYAKLFKKDYLFDNEEFDMLLDYVDIIQPVIDIESLIMDFDVYTKTKWNRKIDEVISIDKNEYIALYFRDKIAEIDNSKDLISNLKKVEILKEKLVKGEYFYDEILSNFLEIGNDRIERIKFLIQEKHRMKMQLTQNQDYLNDIFDKRSKLMTSFEMSVSNRTIDDSHCPFCGFETNELKKLYDVTTETLKQNKNYIDSEMATFDIELDNIFRVEIIRKIDEMLMKHKLLMTTFRSLGSLNKYSFSRIEEKLRQIGDFHFTYKGDNVDFNQFESEYDLLINAIEMQKHLLDKALSRQQIEKYDYTFLTYYENDSIYHNLDDLRNKKNYILSVYSDKCKVELNLVINEYNQLCSKIDEYELKTSETKKNLSNLLAKYEESYKQYQTEVANSIKVPLFILSGKIIQNYPLGLGVNIDVKENQVVFSAQEKVGDVFNMLSTGQLNGLILSILLSIKSVFVNSEKLDILLIDDPLQSIDDISSVSFADVLSEDFSNTQVIVSTHEDDKSNLLKFKYNQAGLRSQSINMQEIYLAN